jgi:diguanylate cyclase (GGDEF)-like protein
VTIATPAIAVAATAVAAAIFGWQHREIVIARRAAQKAQRRFDLLHNLAPALTVTSNESTYAACARILDRFHALVGAQTMLCFFEAGGRLILGAKAGDGYAGFLREGDEYAGGAVVQWAADNARSAIIGPTIAPASDRSGFRDLARDANCLEAGPVAGSRDRVWAVAVPLLRVRRFGLRPQVTGVLYAERPKAAPFSENDLSTTLTIAHLAADALTRTVFADTVLRESERDQLTQLLTPSTFRRRLREEIETRRHAQARTNRDVGLLFIDTDNFKDWNDTFGHAAGDKLLKTLAATLQEKSARGGGFAGRNGGDEFCVGLLDRTKDATIAFAEELRAHIDGSDFKRSLTVDGAGRVKITISIGVAHFPVDVSPSEAQPSDALLELADAIMYDAKRNGRNRVEWRRAAAGISRKA